eukprot:gene4602-5748_t
MISSLLTINQVLSETVEKYPNNRVIIVPKNQNGNKEDEIVTYRELKYRIDSLASALVDIGIGKGDLFGICANQSIEGIVSTFALSKIGAITINMKIEDGGSEFIDIFDSIKFKGLVFSNGPSTTAKAGKDQLKFLLEMIPELKFSNTGQIDTQQYPNLKYLISIDENTNAANMSSMIPGLNHYESLLNRGNQLVKIGFPRLKECEQNVSCYDPSFMILSSGSTGKQKAILRSQLSIVNNGYYFAQRFNLNESDVFGGLFFNDCGIGKTSLVAAITVGAAILTLPDNPFDRTSMIETMDNYRVTTFQSGPTIFHNIINNPKLNQYNLTSLKKGMVSSNVCPVELDTKIKNVLGIDQCIHGYGMSEVMLAFSTNHDTPLETFAKSVGKILPGFQAKLVNSNGEIVPIGEIGHLYIKSYALFLEYYGNKTKTEEVFEDGWFKTGDYAKFDSQGNCEILGRKDDTIFLYQDDILAPKELEDILLTHPKIKNVQVFGIPNEQKYDDIVTWIILNDNNDNNSTFDGESSPSLTLDDVISFLNGRTSIAKYPKYIEIVSEFPLNRNSKPLKRVMREITIQKLKNK